MPKTVERWQCEFCNSVYDTQEEAERCEKHHTAHWRNMELVFTKQDRLPSKVIFTVEDQRTGTIWRIPAKIVISADGVGWECLNDMHFTDNELAMLISRVIPDNVHAEVRTGEPVGREVW